jgi:hypothetical protein
MTRLLCLLVLMAAPASAQWRPVNVSSNSVTAVNENFRRASLYSNRKLDKFANDSVYGSITFAATTATTTFSGWVDIGLVTVSSVSVASVGTLTAVCATGYKALSCSGKCNNGATAPLFVYLSGENTCITSCTPAANGRAEARCARAK